eukprot:SAG22_NODE_2189_length_2863_cov_3.101664_5_plen_60_part_00
MVAHSCRTLVSHEHLSGSQAATMWNYIYTPAEYGPFMPVSRQVRCKALPFCCATTVVLI